MAKKDVIFLNENAQVHTCAFAMTKCIQLFYEWLLDPLYSPVLAPVTISCYKIEEMARRKKIWLQRCHRSKKCLIWGPRQILLLGKRQKIREITESQKEKLISLEIKELMQSLTNRYYCNVKDMKRPNNPFK